MGGWHGPGHWGGKLTVGLEVRGSRARSGRTGVAMAWAETWETPEEHAKEVELAYLLDGRQFHLEWWIRHIDIGVLMSC